MFCSWCPWKTAELVGSGSLGAGEVTGGHELGLGLGPSAKAVSAYPLSLFPAPGIVCFKY